MNIICKEYLRIYSNIQIFVTLCSLLLPLLLPLLLLLRPLRSPPLAVQADTVAVAALVRTLVSEHQTITSVVYH